MGVSVWGLLSFWNMKGLGVVIMVSWDLRSIIDSAVVCGMVHLLCAGFLGSVSGARQQSGFMVF